MLYMVMTLEVSKLSGLLNADASCRESKRGHTVRGEYTGSGGGRRLATAVQTACRRGLDRRFGAGHGEEHTSNMWLMSVTLEVSKLSGWLNADAPCRGSKGRACGAGRGIRVGGRKAASDRGASSVHQERDRLRLGAGHGEERTKNMARMVVTLEVSHLEMSALNFRMFLKSPLMSVTAETSQSTMRPYVAVAAVGLSLYAWTAVFRAALVLKIPDFCTTKVLVSWLGEG